jgi:hypothetical protein
VSVIEGTWEAVITIRIAIPPGQAPEAAGVQLANAGVMVPIGLVAHVKRYDVNIVPVQQEKPKLV